MTRPSLIALEFVVEKLDEALELLVDLLNMELVDRYPHPEFEAEVALLNAGPVAISLLCPTEGAGRPYPEPKPRLAQMTLTIDNESAFRSTRDRLAEAGASAVHINPGLFLLSPSMTEGLFGESPGFVLMLPPKEDSSEPPAPLRAT